MQLITCADF